MSQSEQFTRLTRANAEPLHGLNAERRESGASASDKSGVRSEE